MSATVTTTRQQLSSRKSYSLPLTAELPKPSLPLKRTGALSPEAFPRTRLTPAIGIEFGRDLQLKDILQLKDVEKQRAILNDIAYEISHSGVAFFKAQDSLEAQDLTTLATLLGEAAGKPSDSSLHIHPTQELGENGLPLGQINSKPTKDGRQISFVDKDRSRLASQGWHTDVSFEPRPALYSMLRMHTLPETGGDTLFSSGYAHYDFLSQPIKNLLSGLTATHDAETFRKQAASNGYKLRTDPRGAPENSGDAFQAVHPVVRTNPTTGLQSLYINPTFTTRINELSFDESRALLDYLFKVQIESHDAQVRYRWGVNDVAIWDNRSALHSATFDYGTETRIGDRAVICGEKPFYDPKAIGQEEFLSQQ